MKSNQTFKSDENKVPLQLIDPYFIEEVAKVLKYGTDKYEANSWKKIDNPIYRTQGSVMRHFNEYLKGNIIDPESGLPHLAHCASQLMILMWHERNIKESR